MSTNSLRKIDQKEYLKKYLSGDKVKKKKKDKKHKKSSSPSSVKVKIIDDDVNHLDIGPQIDEELLLTGDDAPQIVGEYIEVNPAESKLPKWRSIGIKEEPLDERASTAHGDKDLWGKKSRDLKSQNNYSNDRKRSVKTPDFSPPRRKVKQRDDASVSPPKRRRNSPSPQRRNKRDVSPYRRRNSDDKFPDYRGNGYSPPRKERSPHSSRRNKRKNSPQSPPRRRRSSDQTIPKRHRDDSPDQSPPRKGSRNWLNEQSPSRKRRTSDQSPPRRGKNQSPPRRRRSSDQSPLRRSRNHSPDSSTPRRKRKNFDKSPSRRERNSTVGQSPTRSRRSSDQSPPRRGRLHSDDQSPPRRRKNSDQSPPRQTRLNNSPPPARHIKREKVSPDSSPRRRSRWERQESEKSLSPSPTHKPKPGKTLEGKKAGLQDAQALHKEALERRKQEDLFFEKMPADISGRHAEVQVRSTGRKGRRAREAHEEDPEERRRKEEHEEKKKHLYERWGKGLKQIEDHKNRLLEQAHESSKPLARYEDDEDLERHLKEQERAEDPMLEYMRQKRKEKEKQSGKPQIPRYEGPFPENRFGIRPGYRWDGVDRSNGYEKKYFALQNEKRARQDEAYKYSVEDM